MSGQGWDETNRNTSEPQVEKAVGLPSEGAGCEGQGQVMHEGTYAYTPAPAPSVKREEKAPSLNTKQQHQQPLLCCLSRLI